MCRARLEQEPTEQGVSTIMGTSPTVQVDENLYHEATATGFGPFESAAESAAESAVESAAFPVVSDDAVEEIQSAETLGPADDAWQGVTVGSYRFLQPLWTVEPCDLYSAQETLSHRQLAVRILELQGDWNSSAAGKLLAEARVLADLRHPGLPRVHEIVLQDGRAFIAMDPEEGVSLEEWLSLAQRTQREKVKVFIGAANALAVLHGAGVVHGDFDPAAVRITADGSVRLANLALARPPQGSEGLSVRYAPPDPIDANGLDGRSEQYSFCAVFFESMTGVLPYEQISDGQARRIPSWLRPIFQRGLHRERTERFESMRQLAQKLRKLWRQRERLRPLLYGTVGLGLLVVLGATLRLLWRRDGSAASTSTTSCVDSQKRIDVA
ncbi:MAG: serine/threonine-protein kinase, partial [Myxococcaceae bacterium]